MHAQNGLTQHWVTNLSGDGVFFQRLDWLTVSGNSAFLRDGLRGIEKETLRVLPNGRLAQTAHPLAIGSALSHPTITTDYSESLLEIVTPPFAQNWSAVQLLCDLHVFLNENIGDELLWPLSMPCLLGDDSSIPIANYGPSNQGMLRTIYRRGLGHRYGRAMQAIAGVHFNYSPPEALWPAFYDQESSGETLVDFKSDRLMGLIRNYYRHAWLVIYLFGASPAFSKSFLPAGNALVEHWDDDTWFAPYATSLRMSDLGYQNKSQARLQVSANSLDEYIAGLTDAMTTPEPRFEDIGIRVDGEYRQLNANVLQIENEYYSTIRPKPPKESVRTTSGLRNHGVEYIEVRTLDLSPADPIGLSQMQMRFLEILLIYCLLEESPPISDEEQNEISARNLSVAREGRRPQLTIPIDGALKTIPLASTQLFSRLTAIADILDDTTTAYKDAVQDAHAALLDPELTPSAELLRDMQSSDAGFIEHACGLASQHREYFREVGLSRERRESFEREARDSLATATQLQTEKSPDFSEFLAKFLREI